MKKNTTKNKKLVKENNKISSYFTKLVNKNANKNGCGSATELRSPRYVNKKSQKENIVGDNDLIYVLDSDEDFIETTPRSHNLKNVTAVKTSEEALRLTNNGSSTPESKKCKHSNQSPLQLKDFEDKSLDDVSNKASSSQALLLTPESKKRKHSKESPTSPDFIPCSLDPREELKYKQFRSCAGNASTPPRKKIAQEIIDLSDLPKEEFLHLHSPSKNENDVKPLIKCKSLGKLMDATPEKQTPEKEKKQTPNQTKKSSPSMRLFNKSPKSLHKFNVEIIERFVTITPSKSNDKTKNDEESACCSNVSTRSLEKQMENERTPTKSPQRLDVPSYLEQSKIKTRLDFSSLADSIDKNNSTNDLSDDNNILNDSWDFNDMEDADCTLDLSESQHCKIIEIENFGHNLKLTVESTKKDKLKAVCNVEGFWTTSRLSTNDTVHISGVYDETKSVWRITNDFGLIVFEPDLLISSTSVVGALFCKRRSVLNEKYRGFEPSNRVMVIGSLVHKLLQEALKNNIAILSEIEVTVKKLLLEKDSLWMCYESDLEIEDVQKELMEFAPRIATFMKQYVREHANGCFNNKKDNWKGKIDKIQDIEENIWCPELGVKGKVDVSVQSGPTMMPLELKTGRATVSLEHRGQVILYVMMMNKFGYNVPSGLLLYLREDVLKEIPVTAKEKRDLTILRNELTYYLTRKPKIEKDGGPLNSLLHSELPPPINHHNACSKCPYSTICCIYLKYEDQDLTNNPLGNLKDDILNHLEPAHLEYFIKWSSLLSLEGSCNIGNKQLHEIYTLPPEEREKRGQCIVSVIIEKVTPECGSSLCKHTFKKKLNNKNLFNLNSSGIGIGNYVVVSTDYRPAVAAGFVTHMDHENITLALDRNLEKRYPHKTFHLDTYNSSISQTFNMTNLSLLLEPTEEAKKLREIVIDKKLPTFNNKLPKTVATKGVPILETLDKMQQRAILKALSSNDYLLIKGMPGTGKTATIVALIQLLVALNKSVLITSHTHSAVDNVCIRLQACSGINLLRLGADSKIHHSLHQFSEEALTRNCVTPQQLEEVYNKANVLAVTCLGSGHPVLNKRKLDVCIVDESTQVLQCSVFRALYSACKFILIGDPDQLPPVIRNREAIARGLSESLFERLDNTNATVTLRYNYRMNKPITAMANALTYNGQLLIANDEIANATLKLPLKDQLLNKYKNHPWIIKILDEDLKSSIKIVNTGPVWKLNKSTSNIQSQHEDELIKYTSSYETAIVIKIVDALLEGGVSSNSIGVIAPFRAQVSQISLALEGKQVEVSTVDQFQGRDKDIVIYSCTKSCDLQKTSSNREFEILEDKRRLTVAITRAKHKFILIGDLDTIRNYKPFANLLASIEEDCFMNLGGDGLFWENIMN